MKNLLQIIFLLAASNALAGNLNFSATVQTEVMDNSLTCTRDFLGDKPIRLYLSGLKFTGVPKRLLPYGGAKSQATFASLTACYRAAIELAGTTVHENIDVPVSYESYEEDRPGATHSINMHRYESRFTVPVGKQVFETRGVCTIEGYLAEKCLS